MLLGMLPGMLLEMLEVKSFVPGVWKGRSVRVELPDYGPDSSPAFPQRPRPSARITIMRLYKKNIDLIIPFMYSGTGWDLFSSITYLSPLDLIYSYILSAD